jgi:hypothetical protein
METKLLAFFSFLHNLRWYPAYRGVLFWVEFLTNLIISDELIRPSRQIKSG